MAFTAYCTRISASAERHYCRCAMSSPRYPKRRTSLRWHDADPNCPVGFVQAAARAPTTSGSHCVWDMITTLLARNDPRDTTTARTAGQSTDDLLGYGGGAKWDTQRAVSCEVGCVPCRDALLRSFYSALRRGPMSTTAHCACSGLMKFASEP